MTRCGAIVNRNRSRECLSGEIEALRAVNADLLAALKDLRNMVKAYAYNYTTEIADDDRTDWDDVSRAVRNAEKIIEEVRI